MSAGSRLETVRRVAQLRETAARAAVGGATARRDVAARHHDTRRAELAGTAPSGGPAGRVHSGLAVLGRRAQDVDDARREVLVRGQERDEAVAGWAEAARRERLLADVCARHRALREAHHERRSQAQLDDLAGRPRGGWQ